jgi:hypothetical protein
MFRKFGRQVFGSPLYIIAALIVYLPHISSQLAFKESIVALQTFKFN